MTKIQSFEIVHLTELDNRPVVLIYALGDNGMLYEMAGGRWIALPINDPVPTLEEVRAESALQQQQQQPPPTRIIRPNSNNNR